MWKPKIGEPTVLTYLIPTTTLALLLFIIVRPLFQRRKTRHREVKVTQLVNGRARRKTQIVELRAHSLYHSTYFLSTEKARGL